MKHFNIFLSIGVVLLILIQLNTGCGNSSGPESNNLPEEVTYQYMIYEEVDDPGAFDPSLWESVAKSLNGSFGTPDQRYDKSIPPDLKDINTSWNVFGWRGERVNTQLVLWSGAGKGKLHFEWTDFKNEEGILLPASSIRARFVRYVLTDEYAGGCTPHMVEGQQISLAADPIDEVKELDYKGKTTRPVWISIDVPENIQPGKYSGKLFVHSSLGEKLEFKIELEVGTPILPDPSQWTYHLDLWQNPSAVARYHEVKPWSEAHYAYLEPLIRRLANAGQKVITTSIIDRPWNGQTQDAYRGMIDWRKKADGTWQFDYDVFDEWVEFVEKCGITEQINCYTMIPWGNRFIYFDEHTESFDTLVARPGSQGYEAHWKPFLLDFSAHLKQKGWFDKTAIAMDEREVEDMQKAIELVGNTVPGMKITLAGGYHPEIEEDLYDMCVASNQVIPEDVMLKRKAAGKFSTFYTCCVEAYPNNFTFSPPAESTWQAWHAAHKGYSGYLRWAYMSWVLEPLKDSRFRNWPAGDTYFVYPEARTSIRFERLREGIQDYEKIRIIRERLTAKGTQQASDYLQMLEDHLKEYKISALETKSAASMLEEGKEILEEISKKALK